MRITEVNCFRCGKAVPENLDLCQHCGALLDLEKPAVLEQLEVLDFEAYSKLIEANLLRLKGAYKQAELNCLAFLQKYPNNPLAYDILGAIYEEQGNLREAFEHYKNASDLNPKGQREKIKLAQLKKLLIGATIAEKAARHEGMANFIRSFFLYTLIPSAVVGISVWLLSSGNLEGILQREPTTSSTTKTILKKEAPKKPIEQIIAPPPQTISSAATTINQLLDKRTRELQEGLNQYLSGEAQVVELKLVKPQAEKTIAKMIVEVAAGTTDAKALKEKIIQATCKILSFLNEKEPNLIEEVELQAFSYFLDQQTGQPYKDLAFAHKFDKDSYIWIAQHWRQLSKEQIEQVFNTYQWHPRLQQ